MEENIQLIKTLIVEGETHLALKRLLVITKRTKHATNAIMLNSRFSVLTEQSLQKERSHEQIGIERNQINLAILAEIEKLQGEPSFALREINVKSNWFSSIKVISEEQGFLNIISNLFNKINILNKK